MPRGVRKIKTDSTLSPQQRGHLTRKLRRRASYRPADSIVESNITSGLRTLIADSPEPLKARHELVADRQAVQSLTAGFTSFICDRLIDSNGAVDPSLADMLVIIAEVIRGANSAQAITITFADAV
jgi:hypothetical protein